MDILERIIRFVQYGWAFGPFLLTLVAYGLVIFDHYKWFVATIVMVIAGGVAFFMSNITYDLPTTTWLGHLAMTCVTATYVLAPVFLIILIIHIGYEVTKENTEAQ